MTPSSAQDALTQARISIEAARKARGSEPTVIKHYRAAKKALAKINSKKTDTATLKEMIVAYEELAMELDLSGREGREKAVKCRQLRQNLELIQADASAIVRVGFALVNPSVVVSSSPSSTALPTLTSNLRVANTVYDFPAPSVDTPSIPQQLTLLSPQGAISVATADVILAAPLFFSKDVNPVSTPDCRPPDLDEPLQSTHQLVYYLALLQDSFVGRDLPPHLLKWLQNPYASHEEKRFMNLAVQMVYTFARDPVKDAATMAEVVQLAPILNEEYSRHLLKSLIDTVGRPGITILHIHSIEWLTKMIQGAAPGSIDSNDLVSVLRFLHEPLQSLHRESEHQYHLLLVAVSRVLDAMVDADVGGIDRDRLHGPLTEFLQESESNKNPYLAFQAAYATQALLNVSDDENIWRAGFRRGWLVLKGGAGFAKMHDPTEIKDALEGLERLYEAGKGGIRFLKNASEAIKLREAPTFTVKEGLKFKRAWYRALRIAESYVMAGNLVKFQDLVTTSPCRDQLQFQWGICQLLGQFAADSQWDLEARRGAVAFLRAYHEGNRLWNRQKEVDEVIYDMLLKVVSSKDMYFEAAKTLLEDMGRRSASIDGYQWQAWNNSLLGGSDQQTSENKLLRSVQNRNRRYAKLEYLPDVPLMSSIDDIQSALEAYHAPNLFIRRVSGDELDLDSCFVNLAIIEAPAQRETEKQDLKEQANIFHRSASSERVRDTNAQSMIPLEHLFNKRELCDGQEDAPKRILVQGRAGIGKTTLCKKLVHAHQNNLWRDRFDIVLWLQLRQLRGSKCRNMDGLFREKVFPTQDLQKQATLAMGLSACAQKGKVLFILDGLDEIVTDTRSEDSYEFTKFLKLLLSQQHVIITSRPSGLDSSLLPPIDLELATVGFSPQDVNEFLVKVLKPEAVKTVQGFIRQTPLIRGLVNIPVQLDVICFIWDSLPKDGPAITMTRLYQLMVQKLCYKDAYRLKKTSDGEVLTQSEIWRLEPDEIEGLMASELHHLGYLAFKGLNNNHQIEFNESDLISACRELKGHATDSRPRLPHQLVAVMKETSFLHTADMVSRHGESQQVWHFLHLTFQEYFAARWIVRQFRLRQPYPSTGMMTEEQVTAFFQRHKYNPQYEIVWTMVAGLLERDQLSPFFGLLQGAPRDLIGGRHQQLLASCLNEARAQMDPTVVRALDMELIKWLRYEMQTCQHGDSSRSMLGSQPSFPEISLIETLGSVRSWKSTLTTTLAARSILSDSAVQFLINSLEDDDGSVSSSAATVLGEQSSLSESAIQSLISTIKDKNNSTKAAAALVLGKQSTLSESAIQSLLVALRDEDSTVRSSAASALGRQSTLSESAIRSLITALEDEDWGVQSTAASALSRQSMLSEPAIHSLIFALKNKDENISCSAVVALGNQCALSESATLSLINALKDSHQNIRTSAASVLGKQSSLPGSAIQSLIAALNDEHQNVRTSAAAALDRQSTMSEPSSQSFTATLKDKKIRPSMASASGKTSSFSESSLQSLTDALQDDDWRVRASAASVLGKRSTLSEAAMQSLIAALKDDHQNVRSSVVSALSKRPILSDSVIQLLVAALKDKYQIVSNSAAAALGRQSTLPQSAIHALTVALESEHQDVRTSAALALSKQPTLLDPAVQSLIALVQGEQRPPAASALNKPSSFSESTVQPPSTTPKDKGTRSSVPSASITLIFSPESSIESLIDGLQDKKWNVRASAASVLGKNSTLSDPAIQSLIAALQDEHQNVRSSAVSALGKQPMLSESVVQSLAAALEDTHQIVSNSAAVALGRQSTLSEPTIRALTAALKSEHRDVRKSAALALSKHSALLDPSVHCLITATQGELGSPAASALDKPSLFPESASQSPDVAVKDKGARSSVPSASIKLAFSPESSVQSLIDGLQDDDWRVRTSAASVLGKHSTLSDPAMQSLIAALQDEHQNVRSSAVSALGKQPMLSESVVQSLAAALEDTHQIVSNSAAVALGRQSTLSEPTIRALTAALKSEHRDVRKSAALALSKHSALLDPSVHCLITATQGELGSPAASALDKPSLFPESASQSPDVAVKDKGARSSVPSAPIKLAFSPESSVQSLIDGLQDDDWRVRTSAASVLGKHSTLSDPAMQSLIAALQDEHQNVRSSAVSTLGKQPLLSESVVQSLAAALEDTHQIVINSAAAALGRQSTLSETAIHALTVALKSEHRDVRYSAVAALGKQSTLSESAIQSLVTALKDEHQNVRTSAVVALSKQSTLSASAMQSLVAALKNEHQDIRYSAAAALGEQSALLEFAIQPPVAAVKNSHSTLVATALGESTLSESAIQSLAIADEDKSQNTGLSAVVASGDQFTFESTVQPVIASLKDEDWSARSSAGPALGNKSTLSEAPIQTMIAALEDKRQAVRLEAAVALGEQSILSELAIQPLVTALMDVDWKVKTAAASALGKKSTLLESAVKPLIAALKDSDWRVRSSAAVALGKQATLSESAIQSLVAALKDEHQNVRPSAVAALGKQSMLPESAIRSLVTALRDEHQNVRYSAAAALGKRYTLSESAIQSLITTLKDEFQTVRTLAAAALGQQSSLSGSAIQSLLAALKYEDENVSSLAAEVLSSQPMLSEPIIQSLIAALQEKNQNVRASAALVLGKQSTLSESAVHPLIASLKDEEWTVRSSAASALGKHSFLSETAIESLIAALQDEDFTVRSKAASALGKQSPLSEAATQFLIAALRDEDDDVRISAVAALGSRSALSETAIQSLVAALKDKHQSVRSSATVALGKRSKLSESAVQSLIAALNDGDWKVRSSAAVALGKQSTSSESTIQALVAALKDEHQNVRPSVVAALGKRSTLPEPVIQSLIASLQDSRQNVRYSVVAALGKQPVLSEFAMQSLLDAFNDEHQNVRTSVAVALGKRPTLSVSAIRSLIARLKDESKHVRRAVSETLRHHCHSLCNSFPHLTEEEIGFVYENHMFRYSCSHVLSLQLQDGKLCFYTEQGALHLEPTGHGEEEKISSVLQAIQHNEGLF
ncbi:bilin biosynthesis protein [Entomortierella parvispora]|uniref:Bilin biosynthesis protein n=1 Tax=Entomortierella parvispora TaxID=205924 RepID=A0A9P3LWX2_9FUNG|nr:bilin biosynthesis protein [Entomortierella parvispora]